MDGKRLLPSPSTKRMVGGRVRLGSHVTAESRPFQFCSTTTLRSGGRGTTLEVASGALRAADSLVSRTGRSDPYRGSRLSPPVPGAYCTGKAGIEASEASSVANMLKAAGEREDQRAQAQRDAQKSLAEQHLETLAANKGKAPERGDSQNYSKKQVGEGDVDLDRNKLASALAAERKRKGMGEEEAFESLKKAKSLNVTEEEMGEPSRYAPSTERQQLIPPDRICRGLSAQ